MKLSIKPVYLSILITLFGLVVGCASMNSGSNVTIKKHKVAKNCELRGNISYSQEMQSMDSDSKEKLYSAFRNKAAQLGANTILLTSSGSVIERQHHHGKNMHYFSENNPSAEGMTHLKHYHGKNMHKVVAVHYLSGKAYWCPEGKM